MAEMSHPEASAEGLTQANADKDTRPVYEVSFHVVPTVEEAGVGEVVEKIRAELTKGNIEIIKEQFPQKMTLAYTIERAAAGKREKYVETYFGFIKFAAERETIPGLEALLRSSKEILRYLLIETTREEPVIARRAVYSSNRLEG
ncbi:MAG: 30S ribosomal protein S6, partial [Candidatus Adlerbacteria bacterium]|nr:30S ribosomal protein S6 [Candidatus Adlerbacteria bacterium]